MVRPFSVPATSAMYTERGSRLFALTWASSTVSNQSRVLAMSGILPSRGTGCHGAPGERSGRVGARRPDRAGGADPGARGPDQHQAAHVDGVRVQVTERGYDDGLRRAADVPADDHHDVGRPGLEQHLLRLAQLVRA